MPHEYILGAITLGLVIGSFLNVIIPRLHHSESGIFFGRSHCPKCFKRLSITENIPVLSYMCLRGKCRHCSKHISFWYPAIELSSAGLFAAVAYQANSLEELLWQLGLFSILLFIFFYDLRYKEIHDAVMIPGIVLALIGSFFIGDITSSLLGSAVGLAFFALQYYASRGRAIGAGDMRIGAFMGAVLGLQFTLIALVISYILGSIVSITLLATKKATAKTALPLGPFLVTGTVIAFFYGEQILRWYLTI
jgi:prepilin signal peptidase PulO-like enzyme (type II secretory pathway)